MNPQSKPEIATRPETWAGVDESHIGTQRSGGGFLALLMFPLIALLALVFAASELAK